MRRLATHALLGTLLLIGSGALEYIHNWAHELEDRIEDRSAATMASAASASLPATATHPEHHHDESNCEVHAQLHMAVITFTWTPLLIRLGIWIGFLTLLAVPLIARLLPARIDCRGPPCAFRAISL